MRPDSEMSTKHVHNDENDNLSQRNEGNLNLLITGNIFTRIFT